MVNSPIHYVIIDVIVGTHSGRLEAAVCLHFLFDELLLPPKITELGGQQLPMVFYPRESDSASTKKKRRKMKMNDDDDIVTLSKILSVSSRQEIFLHIELGRIVFGVNKARLKKNKKIFNNIAIKITMPISTHHIPSIQ